MGAKFKRPALLAPRPTRTPTDTPGLLTALLTEAVRLIEQGGPLEDGQAMRGALAVGGGRQAQVTQRAALLAERLGLPARLQRARALAPLVLVGLAALIVLAGLALAGSVVDAQDRRINVMAALVALLGVHAFTLALWLLALLLPVASFGGALGRLWLELTARLTLGRGAEPEALLRALLRLLERARLLPWALGLASHAIWALSFAVVLAVLLFALAFRSYTLSWETTILSPEVFAGWVRALGVVPAALGFPVPDAGTVLAPVADGTGQRQWAWWLIGCVTVYGLLPRVLCALLCAMVWRARRAALGPDFAEPYYRQLFARFDALAPATVVDADGHGPHWRLALESFAGETTDMLAVIGFELPAEYAWPPPELPPSATLVQRIEGSSAERLDILERLTRARPRGVVLVCNAASSPDRGTERFLRELLPTCGECRLWLTGDPAPAEAAVARWRDWLTAAGLGTLHSVTDGPSALQGWV